MYVFIQSFIYISMDTWMFLYFKLYSNTTLFILLLKFSQLWLLETLSGLLFLFDTKDHFGGVLLYSLLSGTTGCSRGTVVCKACQPTCKEHVFLLGKQDLLGDLLGMHIPWSHP